MCGLLRSLYCGKETVIRAGVHLSENLLIPQNAFTVYSKITKVGNE